MKAKQLADRLLQYPTFDVKFRLLEPDGSSYGLCLRTFDVDIEDIGYLSEIVNLGPVVELGRNTSATGTLLKEMAAALTHAICLNSNGGILDDDSRDAFEELLRKYHEHFGDNNANK